MFRMMMVVLTGALLVIVSLYRSTAGGDRADFTYVNPTGINTLDPAVMTWTHDIRIAINIWEGLMAHDPRSGEAIEGSAYWPIVSDDDLVYTFTIRPDARWSNGDPLTADDFIRGWRRAIEPGTASDYSFFISEYVAGAGEYYRWRNDAVAELTSMPTDTPTWKQTFDKYAADRDRRFAEVGVHALDDRTLEVRLSRPCPYFLDLCAFPTLMPIHQSIERLRIDPNGSGITVEGLVIYDPQWTKPDYHVNGYPGLITNGAYRLAEWTFKRRIRLEANPYYHGRNDVSCKTVDMLVYGDINTSIMAYEAGDVDFLTDMNVTYDHELSRLATTGARPDFHCPVVYGVYFYLFNTADAVVDGRPNPFVDARVRKAFCLAVDKKTIAEKVVARGDPPTDNVVPPGSIRGYKSPAGVGFNPDEARRLLAEAGFPDGDGMPVIDILYNTGFHHGKISDVLAEMWRKELGVTVVPRGKETKTYAEDRKNRTFMIARAGWYGDYFDPTTYLDLFATGNGNNDSGYSNAKYDALLTRAAETADPEARYAILAQAEQWIIAEAFPVLPLFQYTQLMAFKPYVKGLYPNVRLMFPFRAVSVER